MYSIICLSPAESSALRNLESRLGEIDLGKGSHKAMIVNERVHDKHFRVHEMDYDKSPLSVMCFSEVVLKVQLGN